MALEQINIEQFAPEGLFGGFHAELAFWLSGRFQFDTLLLPRSGQIARLASDLQRCALSFCKQDFHNFFPAIVIPSKKTADGRNPFDR
jgi:hypothetical protein